MYDRFNSLTTSEAAALIGVHESSVKRWCDAGKLPCSMTRGGHRRIGFGELLAFAERENVPSTILRFRPYAQVVWNGLQRVRDEGDYTALQELTYRWFFEGPSFLTHQLLVWLMEQGIAFSVLCDRLIGPALYRVGHGWQQGTVEVGMEHVITHVILDSLQALRLSVGSHADVPKRSQPVALVGCGSESDHEVGAQCTRFVLEEAGWRVVYLGPRLPIEDAARLQERFKASLVCLSMTAPHVAGDMLRTARTFARSYRPDLPYRLALGGPAVPETTVLWEERLPFEEVRVFERITPFAAWIKSFSPNTIPYVS